MTGSLVELALLLSIGRQVLLCSLLAKPAKPAACLFCRQGRLGWGCGPWSSKHWLCVAHPEQPAQTCMGPCTV